MTSDIDSVRAGVQEVAFVLVVQGLQMTTSVSYTHLDVYKRQSLFGSHAVVVGTKTQKENRTGNGAATGGNCRHVEFCFVRQRLQFRSALCEAVNPNARSFQGIDAGASQSNRRLENCRAKGRRDSREMVGNVWRHQLERARRSSGYFQSDGRGGCLLYTS